MDVIDYMRDGWADGIEYKKAKSPLAGHRLGAVMNDGRHLLHKSLIPSRVSPCCGVYVRVTHEQLGCVKCAKAVDV